jgi:hypothetical protein
MHSRFLRALALAFCALAFASPSYAAGFSASAKACLNVVQSGTSGLTATVGASGSVSAGISAQTDLCWPMALTYGTGNSQGNQHYVATRTLALSANEDLDLNGATLKDPLGASLAFTKIRYILVHASPNNGGNIVVKPAAANGFLGPFNLAASSVAIPAGGWFTVTAPVAGWAVTATTADLINVANSDSVNSAIYDIVLLGN